MIVYYNPYNKVLKRKLKRTGKSKTKTCLTAVSIVYSQNIRDSDRKFLLEAKKRYKIVMFRTYNFLHTC